MGRIVWIVFFGVRGSGKSTLGEYLAKQFQFKVDAFANPLKQAAQTIFGFTDADLYGPSSRRSTQYTEFVNTGWCFSCHAQCVYEDSPRMPLDLKEPLLTHPWWCALCNEQYPRFLDPRHVLKTLGTEYGRRICLNLWVQTLFTHNRGNPRLAVTDGRFINENEACQQRSVYRVLLTRGLKDSSDPHPSEAEVREQARQPQKYFDFVLDNEGQALEVTRAQLHSIVKTLIGD